jgi:hypothetical protein
MTAKIIVAEEVSEVKAFAPLSFLEVVHSQ